MQLSEPINKEALKPAPRNCPRCFASRTERSLCPKCGELWEQGVVIGGRYELEHLLGAGGMGFVYAAKHTMLGKAVALKLLREELCGDADQVGRFMREAQLCSQISHENIVDITDFGRDEAGRLYLVMELIIGTTLAELLEQQEQLSLKRSLGILRQLCRAIQCAHGAGVVHRDLNPRNISLTEASGRTDMVKLLDFGISRLMDGRDRVTSTGVALGTTPYMPPEQLRGEECQDHRVDIYAVGVIACELLTGKVPFVADTPAQLIAEKLMGDPIDLRATDLGAKAPAIAEMVNECLAGDPRQRPGSAAEVEQRLLSSLGSITDQNEDLAGMRAGSYRLVKLLGAGGLGSVWLGEHPVIGSRVAVKILHPEMCEFEEAVRRFVVEAQAVNQIDSPHIVKTFDFGKLPDGRDYAVMELLRGETLSERLKQTGAMEWSAVQPIAAQLCRALISAHGEGIIHRDLKPENIHLAEGEAGLTVKVLDFGIAKLLDNADVAVTHRTKMGVCMGTPLYAAPEQTVGQPIDASADIYAFGVVLYELLAGRPPFGGTIQELLMAKNARCAPPLEASAPGLPPELHHLVDTMLSISPTMRPTAQQVYEMVTGGARLARQSSPILATAAPDVPTLLEHQRADHASPVPGALAAPTVSDALAGAEESGGLTPLTLTREPRWSLSPRAMAAAGAVVVVLLGLAALFFVSGSGERGGAETSLQAGSPEGEPVRSSGLERSIKPRAEALQKDQQGKTPEGVAVRGPEERQGKGAPEGRAVAPAPEPKPERRLIKIHSTPSGAAVQLRGQAVGRTPLSMRIDPRLTDLELSLRLKGYQLKRLKLDAASLKSNINIPLKRVRVRRGADWADPFQPSAEPRRTRKIKKPRAKTPTKLVDPFED